MPVTIHGTSLRRVQRPVLGALTDELLELREHPKADEGARLDWDDLDLPNPAPEISQRLFPGFGHHLIGVGRSRRDEETFIAGALADLEQDWGRSVTDVPLAAIPRRGIELAVRKAAQLERMNLTPDRVTEAVIKASGTAFGRILSAHRVFTQRFRPEASKALGKIVVLSPSTAQA